MNWKITTSNQFCRKFLMCYQVFVSFNSYLQSNKMSSLCSRNESLGSQLGQEDPFALLKV